MQQMINRMGQTSRVMSSIVYAYSLNLWQLKSQHFAKPAAAYFAESGQPESFLTDAAARLR